MRKTVTIVIPSGYFSGEEFAADCGYEVSTIVSDLMEALEKITEIYTYETGRERMKKAHGVARAAILKGKNSR
jgi:hypothetical protein